MSRNLTEDEIKEKLTKEEYDVMRNKATERPFSGEFLDINEDGVFKCKVCGQELFDTDTKFDSGTGWPSFYDVIDKDNVDLKDDKSHGMNRTEVLCSFCGSHLGHMFPDGPEPTGKRYCINSLALEFESGSD